MITLFSFRSLRFSIFDKGSREVSFKDLSDFSLDLFSLVNRSEPNFSCFKVKENLSLSLATFVVWNHCP